MRDDAIAPVIAAMLLLAVLATAYAAWNTYYIPSLKAQSDFSHITGVEQGMIKFSSDIETAVSLKRNMRLSELVPLGGGEILFDGTKSGGTLTIRNDTRAYLLTGITNGTLPIVTTSRLRIANYSYQPVENFWRDQGYEWNYGVMNVSRGRLTTPLQVTCVSAADYGLAGVLTGMTIDSTCSRMDLYLVNITPDPGHTRATGSGNGMLVLESRETNLQVPNVTKVNFSINHNMPPGFQQTLFTAMSRETDTLACSNIRVTYHRDPGAGLNGEMGMEFDAIPNMTINRRINEITLGAY
ncbi:MAG: hypothetical protein GYA23_03130 [Methanomicrobiales archaeon]|nr:hypothetical protein [Methanomicrobiales archaeon]